MAAKNSYQLNRSGDITYGKNVLRSIITLAAKEITGVAALHGKGIKIDYAGNTINVEVFLNVYYGNNVSDVAFRVQENIKRSVETMSGYKVGAINVSVLGVSFSTEEV